MFSAGNQTIAAVNPAVRDLDTVDAAVPRTAQQAALIATAPMSRVASRHWIEGRAPRCSRTVGLRRTIQPAASARQTTTPSAATIAVDASFASNTRIRLAPPPRN